jgi:hypothetical protein
MEEKRIIIPRKEAITLSGQEQAIIDEIREREQWQKDLKPWAIAAIKHYIAWLSGLVVSVAGFFGMQNQGTLAWLWWMALAVGVLVSSFQTWKDQEKIIKELARRLTEKDTELQEERNKFTNGPGERLKRIRTMYEEGAAMITSWLTRDSADIPAIEAWISQVTDFISRNLTFEEIKAIENPQGILARAGLKAIPGASEELGKKLHKYVYGLKRLAGIANKKPLYMIRAMDSSELSISLTPDRWASPQLATIFNPSNQNLTIEEIFLFGISNGIETKLGGVTPIWKCPKPPFSLQPGNTEIGLNGNVYESGLDGMFARMKLEGGEEIDSATIAPPTPPNATPKLPSPTHDKEAPPQSPAS